MPREQSSEPRLLRQSSKLLDSIGSARIAGRNLILANAGLGLPNMSHRLNEQTLPLLTGEAGIPGRLSCRSESLPFQEDVFDHVIVHHVLNDGSEPELDEACRVLRPGGHMIIIGLNALGLRHMARRSRDKVPGVRVSRLCEQLKRRNFLLEQCAGCGIAGLTGPGPWQQGWERLPLPLADVVMIVARHHEERPVTTLLRYARPQVSGARNTAADSFKVASEMRAAA